MALRDDFDFRDLFGWNGAARTDSFPLPRRPVPDALDLRGRLNTFHLGFCPSLNCIDFYCPVHISTDITSFPTDEILQWNLTGDSWPRQPPPIAIKTAGDLWRECEGPCGPECFRNIERGDMSEEIAWEDWDWEEFRTILEISPDALPCRLAVLCRKPCREVRLDRLYYVLLLLKRTDVYAQDCCYK